MRSSRNALAAICLVTIALHVGSAPSLRMCATPEQVQHFAGTRDVKLVFNIEAEMYLLDFSQPDPKPEPLVNGASGYFPVISPDGQRVVYQTGCDLEGPKGNSPCPGSVWTILLSAPGNAVQVASEGYVPRFVDSSVDTPVVIYSTTIDCKRGSFPPWDTMNNGYSLCQHTGMVLSRKVRNGIEVQPADTIWSNGSYYGGISSDGRYLSTGWPAGKAFMLDLQDTARGPLPMHILTLRNPQTNRDTLACCFTSGFASRSPSRRFPNTLLYADVPNEIMTKGYVHPVWGKWKSCELLFIARMTDGPYGEQIRVLDQPEDQPLSAGTAADTNGAPMRSYWWTPEWSNHPYYAVASLGLDRLFKPSGSYKHIERAEAVYLIDLKEKRCLRLISSDDTSFESTTSLVNPYVWIKVPDGFVEDVSWLADIDSSRAPLRATGIASFPPTTSVGGAPSQIRGRVIVSSTPIQVVRIFSPAGRLVWQSPTEGNGVRRMALPRLGAGAFLVKVDSRATGPLMMRWTVR